MQHLRTISATPRQPVSLYGAFKGKFPEDFDVDATIHEARTAWKKKFEDLE